MTFLTSIIGLCMGSGILFSMYFGAKKYEKMKISFFVSIGILSIILEVICFLLLKYILVWLQIPQVIYNQTAKYLQIIFIGIIFTFIYNYFAAMLLISAFIWCRNDLVGNCYWMDFSGYNWYCIWYKNRKKVQVKNTAFAVFFISYFD